MKYRTLTEIKTAPFADRVNVTVAMERTMRDQLDAIAKAHDTSIAEIMRSLAERFLKKGGNGND